MFRKWIRRLFSSDAVPVTWEKALKKGEVLLLRGDFQPALACFEHVVAIQPEYFPVYQMMGIIHLMTGQFQAAITRMDIFLKHEVTLGAAWYIRGLAYLGENDITRAQKDIEQSLHLQPDCYDACVSLATCYFEKQQMDAAMHWIERALAIQPICTEAYYLRAAIEMKQNKYHHAVQDFSVVLAQDGLRVDAYHKRAACYIAMDDRERAMNDLVRTLYIDQSSAPIYWARGLKQLAAQAYGRAWMDFKQAAQLESQARTQVKLKKSKSQLPEPA